MERLFNLDPQLLHDAVLLALAVFVLFVFLSYVLFNPVRDMLKKREDRVKNDIESAEKDKAEAKLLREEYEAKIKNIQAEADEIMSESRKNALANETKILDEAKDEAVRIRTRAEKDIELEKQKVKDDMKQEMVSVAAMMAGKFVSASMDPQVQDSLIDETLKEMGDTTWQN